MVMTIIVEYDILSYILWSDWWVVWLWFWPAMQPEPGSLGTWVVAAGTAKRAGALAEHLRRPANSSATGCFMICYTHCLDDMSILYYNILYPYRFHILHICIYLAIGSIKLYPQRSGYIHLHHVVSTHIPLYHNTIQLYCEIMGYNRIQHDATGASWN